MIVSTIIEGRKATVAYLHSDWSLATPDDADLLKVVYDNGDVIFLKPAPIATKDYNPDPKWTKGEGGKFTGSEPGQGGGGEGEKPKVVLSEASAGLIKVTIGGKQVGLYTTTASGLKFWEQGTTGQVAEPVEFVSVKELGKYLTNDPDPEIDLGNLPMSAITVKLAPSKVEFDPPTGSGMTATTVKMGGEVVGYATGGNTASEPILYAVGAVVGGGPPAVEFSSWEALAEALETHGPSAKPEPPEVVFEKPSVPAGYSPVKVNGKLVGHASGGELSPSGTFSMPVIYIPLAKEGGGPNLSSSHESWEALKASLQKEATPSAPPEVVFEKPIDPAGQWPVTVGGKLVGHVSGPDAPVTFIPLSGTGMGGQTKWSLEALKTTLQKAAMREAAVKEALPPHVPHPTLQAAASVPIASLPAPVVRVGGSDWNRDTAIRLGKEHAYVKPEIERSIDAVIGTSTSTNVGSWTELGDTKQTDVEDRYKEQHYDYEYQSNVNYWQENEAEGEALRIIVRDSDDGINDDWAYTAIEEIEGERERPYPFTAEQIIEAVNIDAEDSYESAKVSFEWDDDALNNPIGFDPDQQWLPGMEAPPPHTRLTPEMRKEIEGALEAKLREEAKDKAGELETPEYISEQTTESVSEAWDQLDDHEKFLYGVQQGIISEAEEGEGEVVMPAKLDPMNENTDSNYVDTQRFAKAFSVDRAVAVMKQRGIDVEPEQVRELDERLWSGWVSSSTGLEGEMLQVISADELGGRVNTDRLDHDLPEFVQLANTEFSDVGGYEGLKAYIRGKWEATQELLDRAGVQEVEVYRAIHPKAEERGAPVSHPDGMRLPDADIKRNGLASFSTDADVTNGWGSQSTRVVIRARVPRTAVISIPAYGKNIHREREVILAGTGWIGWDAWMGMAPSFEQTPLPIERP